MIHNRNVKRFDDTAVLAALFISKMSLKAHHRLPVERWMVRMDLFKSFESSPKHFVQVSPSLNSRRYASWWWNLSYTLKSAASQDDIHQLWMSQTSFLSCDECDGILKMAQVSMGLSVLHPQDNIAQAPGKQYSSHSITLIHSLHIHISSYLSLNESHGKLTTASRNRAKMEN